MILFNRIFCGLLCFCMLLSTAHASMVTTEEVIAPVKAAEARDRIKTLAQRPEIAKELSAMGLSAEQAQSRVDAMTNAEVVATAGKLDSLPAGGSLSSSELIIILLLVVILALVL